MQDPFHSIDITLPVDTEIKSTGIAYYRLDDEFHTFILKCMEENRILGFAWEGTRNFGLILQAKPPLKNKAVDKKAGAKPKA